jgi:hypothetical protein
MMPARTPIGWRAWIAYGDVYTGPLRVNQQSFGTWAGARLWIEQGRVAFPDSDAFGRFAGCVVPVFPSESKMRKEH